VLENPARDPLVVDKGDQPHRPLAPRAGHDLDGEYPFQQLGPREPALADRVVGAVVARVIDSNVKRWSAREERIDSAREERVDSRCRRGRPDAAASAIDVVSVGALNYCDGPEACSIADLRYPGTLAASSSGK
jgi:hypothetical protein